MIPLERAWHSINRQVRGERHPQAKLTDVQVAEIRARYRRGLAEALGAEFGITGRQVLRIVRKERRK